MIASLAAQALSGAIVTTCRCHPWIGSQPLIGTMRVMPLPHLATRRLMRLVTAQSVLQIDSVYLKELSVACCSSVAATPRLGWNLRVTADDQALIDRAVRTSGLTRTDFVLQAARTAARELLVQQSWQAVSAETFNQFLRQLDAPWALTAETPASTTGSSSVLWPTSKAVRLWLWPLARWLWPLPPGVFDATCLIPFPWWCLHGWRSAAVPRDAASWFMLPPRKLAVSTSTWVLIPHPSIPTPC